MILNIYKTNNDRVILTIVIRFTDMQRRVKEESSHLAIRTRDKEGTSLFDEFVLDEGYETKFRSYFYSAQGELSQYLSAYTKDVPVSSSYLDTSAVNSVSSEDWKVILPMPSNFNEAVSKSIGFKIEDFFENYIMWLWLSTKDAYRAEVYLTLSQKLAEEIKNLLNRRSENITRPNCYW